MDPDGEDRRVAVRRGWAAPATYGRGRANRLDPELYCSDIPTSYTICADHAKPFANDVIAEIVCSSVETSARLLSHRLYAYCLMPDHLHVMISAAESRTSTSRFLQKMKSFTTNQYHELGGVGRLWQSSARDSVLRGPEALRDSIAYMLNNPVRAQLVPRWDMWPYSRLFFEL